MILSVVVKSAVLNQVNFGAYGVYVRVGAVVIDTILDLYDYYLHQNWDNVTSSVSDAAQMYRKDYDIRTARRIRGEDRQLTFAITNNAASGGSIVWTVSGRFLLKAS